MATDDDWWAGAACRGTDPEIFFPGRGVGKSAEAKRICQACPVVLECLADALTDSHRLGVWGGTTERERRQIAKRLRESPDTALADLIRT